jgi:hypothetical protein
MGTRTRSIQVYLREGVLTDDILFALWEQTKSTGKPQELLRRLLWQGLQEEIKLGTIVLDGMNGNPPPLIVKLPDRTSAEISPAAVAMLTTPSSETAPEPKDSHIEPLMGDEAYSALDLATLVASPVEAANPFIMEPEPESAPQLEAFDETISEAKPVFGDNAFASEKSEFDPEQEPDQVPVKPTGFVGKPLIFGDIM